MIEKAEREGKKMWNMMANKWWRQGRRKTVPFRSWSSSSGLLFEFWELHVVATVGMTQLGFSWLAQTWHGGMEAVPVPVRMEDGSQVAAGKNRLWGGLAALEVQNMPFRVRSAAGRRGRRFGGT